MRECELCGAKGPLSIVIPDMCDGCANREVFDTMMDSWWYVNEEQLRDYTIPSEDLTAKPTDARVVTVTTKPAIQQSPQRVSLDDLEDTPRKG